MRILVVDSQLKERDATLRLLPADTHEIRVAKDGSEALHCVETHEFDVILVESTLPGMSGCELVKRICAGESGTHVYVIMTAAHPTPGDVKNAFHVGADDFIRKPMAHDELVARLDGPIRIRAWASKVLIAGACLDVAARSALTSMAAWTRAEMIICSELSEMLGLAISPRPHGQALDGAVHIGTLPFAIATEHLEIALAVGVDATSAAALADAMFGAPDVGVAALRDMVREFANVGGGAFKRLAATEGRLLTTGVPGESTPHEFRHPRATARKHWIGTVPDRTITLRFELELRAKEPKRVRVTALREGMVIASEVRNPLGGLLIPSGTRITESHVWGLRRTLGADASVDVMEAA